MKTSRTARRAVIAIAAVASAALPAAALAAGGVLDLRFGNQGPVPAIGGGVSILNPTAGNDEARDVLGLADGTILIGGRVGGFSVARLGASGRLDTTFSGDGVATVGAETGVVNAVGTGNTLPLLAAGTGPDPRRPFAASDGTVALLRGFTPTGALAPLNGSTQGLVISFGRNVDTTATSLAVDAPFPASPASPPPPPLLAVGGSFTDATVSPIRRDAFVARVTGDGTPVTAFGGDGTVTLPDIEGAGSLDEVRGVAFTGPNRSVVAVGFSQHPGSNGRAFVVKLTPQGQLDPAFGGGDGIVSGQFGCGSLGANTFDAVTVDPQGRIVATGSCRGLKQLIVTRLLPDGTPDPSFSGDGSAVVDGPGGALAVGGDIVRQADGSLVVGGSVFADGERRFAAAGFTDAGALDTGFGDGGFIVTDPAGSPLSEARGITTVADGNVVAAGRGGAGIMLAKYRTAPTGG